MRGVSRGWATESGAVAGREMPFRACAPESGAVAVAVAVAVRAWSDV